MDSFSSQKRSQNLLISHLLFTSKASTIRPLRMIFQIKVVKMFFNGRQHINFICFQRNPMCSILLIQERRVHKFIHNNSGNGLLHYIFTGSLKTWTLFCMSLKDCSSVQEQCTLNLLFVVIWNRVGFYLSYFRLIKFGSNNQV